MESNNLEETLDLPDFVAHLLNQVAKARNRRWLETKESLGHRIVGEIAVCTGFFNADDPEGVTTIKSINAHADTIYGLLDQAENGKVLNPQDFGFLEQ